MHETCCPRHWLSEQRYEVLLGNFLAMELAFTEIGLRAKVEPQHRYLNLAEILETANRSCVVNTLTAMRAMPTKWCRTSNAWSCFPYQPGGQVGTKNEAFSRSLDYRFTAQSQEPRSA